MTHQQCISRIERSEFVVELLGYVGQFQPVSISATLAATARHIRGMYVSLIAEGSQAFHNSVPTPRSVMTSVHQDNIPIIHFRSCLS
ncbi:hypothetical protein A0W34_30520 (plasmid) [Rhodococcus sp. BH4]|nr:hypothetical protein A0W34_30520 [Rhodococcus sp. BH4]